MVPYVWSMYPDRKYVLQQIQHWQRHQDHPEVLGGTLDSSRMAAILTRLEPAGLLYLENSAVESLGDASRQSGIHRTCRSFFYHLGAVVAKNGTDIE